ncbi:hypothetical protein MRF4_12475 [Methylobacterium radiotolerans]|uniref:MATE family efflux transporter n=1 Tax=Methylobacterium radiotolerans TaxID=31998 RepID=UPI002F325D59
MRPVDLDQDRVVALVLRLSGPAILGISAHALQMLVNAWFVADLGAAAIATIALAYPVTLLVAALGYGAGIAAASQVSRALGAGDADRAAAAAGLGFWLSLPAGLAVTGAIAADTPFWLRLLGADAALAAEAAPYTALATIGTALMLVMIVGGFVVRAQGHARLSGAVMVGSFGLNILLDVLLIRVCGLGTVGAGWAAIGAQLAGAAAYGLHFARARGPDRVSIRWPGGRIGVSLAAQGLALIPPLLILPPLLGYAGVLASRVAAEFLADGLGLTLILAWGVAARRAGGAAPVEGREAVQVAAAHETAHQGA